MPLVVHRNPFTAPACKISGVKDARAHLQTVHFPVLRPTFNAVRLNENPLTCQCEKEDKKAHSLRFRTFTGRF